MKPTPLVVTPEGISDALKRERRWCLWRYELRAGTDRWAKVPCMTTRHYARPNDPSTWTMFDQVIDAYQTRRFDGLGFMLGDGWAGIDLDACIDNTAADGALQRLRALGVYIETSPSGTGLKAIGRSSRTGGEVKFDLTPPAFTTWQGARFFAITGQGQGDALVDITAVIDEWFPQRSTALSRPDLGPVPKYIRVGDTRGTEFIETFTDEQIVDRILASAQSLKFIKLVRGDVSDYGDDHSRADQALVNILYYWSNGDRDQVDRLFRESALMRDKWNVRSYREATLLKAAASAAL